MTLAPPALIHLVHGAGGGNWMEMAHSNPAAGGAEIGWPGAGALSATVAAGGANYQVGDILTPQGFERGIAPRFTVATLAGDAVATVTLLEAGQPGGVLPTNPLATVSVRDPGNLLSWQTANPNEHPGGTGCTLNVTWDGNAMGAGMGGRVAAQARSVFEGFVGDVLVEGLLITVGSDLAGTIQLRNQAAGTPQFFQFNLAVTGPVYIPLETLIQAQGFSLRMSLTVLETADPRVLAFYRTLPAHP